MVKLLNAVGVKGNYRQLKIFNFLAMMFSAMTYGMSMVVNDGGGTAGEQEKAEKELADKLSKGVTKQINEFRDEFKTIAQKGLEGVLKKEEVDEKLKTLEANIGETLKDNVAIKELFSKINEANEEVRKMSATIAEMKEPNMPTNERKVFKGFGTLLKDKLTEAGLTEEIDIARGLKATAVKGWDSKAGRHVVKAAVDMTTALSVRPGADPGTAIGGITDYKMRDVQIDLTKDTHAINFLPTDPVNDKYMGVLVESDYVDGSATKAEGSASGQSSLKFSTKEFKVFTIATHFRVSKENLQDIDRLESKLNRIAPDRIMSDVDSKIFSALGNNSTEMEGMYVAGNYTAFNSATYENTVANANIIDLIRKMKLQAHNNDNDVNVVILHPTQVDEIEGLKDANQNYLSSRAVVYDNNGNLVRVHGLTVIKNKKPGTDKVTVMWNEAAEIGVRSDIEYEVGLDGNDLTEGMRTIVFDFRVAFGVGKASSIIVSTDPDTDISVLDNSTPAG